MSARRLNDLHGIFAQRLDFRLPLLAFGRRSLEFENAHLRLEKRVGQDELANRDTLEDLGNDEDRLVRLTQSLKTLIAVPTSNRSSGVGLSFVASRCVTAR